MLHVHDILFSEHKSRENFWKCFAAKNSSITLNLIYCMIQFSYFWSRSATVFFRYSNFFLNFSPHRRNVRDRHPFVREAYKIYVCIEHSIYTYTLRYIRNTPKWFHILPLGDVAKIIEVVQFSSSCPKIITKSLILLIIASYTTVL